MQGCTRTIARSLGKKGLGKKTGSKKGDGNRVKKARSELGSGVKKKSQGKMLFTGGNVRRARARVGWLMTADADGDVIRPNLLINTSRSGLLGDSTFPFRPCAGAGALMRGGGGRPLPKQDEPPSRSRGPP